MAVMPTPVHFPPLPTGLADKRVLPTGGTGGKSTCPSTRSPKIGWSSACSGPDRIARRLGPSSGGGCACQLGTCVTGSERPTRFPAPDRFGSCQDPAKRLNSTAGSGRLRAWTPRNQIAVDRVSIERGPCAGNGSRRGAPGRFLAQGARHRAASCATARHHMLRDRQGSGLITAARLLTLAPPAVDLCGEGQIAHGGGADSADAQQLVDHGGQQPGTVGRRVPARILDQAAIDVMAQEHEGQVRCTLDIELCAKGP